MNIKNFIFGAIVGGALSGVSVYLITKKKMQDECEETVCRMREYYIEKYAVQKAEIMEEKKDPSEIVKEYKENIEKYNDISSKYRSKIVDPAEKERPTDDAPEEYYENDGDGIVGPDPAETKGVIEGMAADAYSKANHDRAPEVISENEFGTAPGFGEAEYTYYVEDLTFCDENDMVIDVGDENRLFGSCLTDWKNNDNIGEDICVRNYQYEMDLRIEKRFCKCPGYLRTE